MADRVLWIHEQLFVYVRHVNCCRALPPRPNFETRLPDPFWTGRI
jgi:hypothetical protein